MRNKLEKKVAKIEHIVNDQGGGGSYCSNCSFTLTEYLDNYFSNDSLKRAKTGLDPEKDLTTFLKKNYRVCPSCKYMLVEGDTYVNWGGSDF